MSESVMSSITIKWSDYYELCKPKVVMLLVFTAIVGMFLAVPGMVPWQPLVFGSIGIALASASAAAINHVVDQKVDEVMARTKNRPLPQGSMPLRNAIIFALAIGIIGLVILWFLVNALTAILTFPVANAGVASRPLPEKGEHCRRARLRRPGQQPGRACRAAAPRTARACPGHARLHLVGVAILCARSDIRTQCEPEHVYADRARR